MMLAEGLKQNWIDWPEGALDSTPGYIMIVSDGDDFKMTPAGTNWAAALKKFETATKKEKGILMHSNKSWQR